MPNIDQYDEKKTLENVFRQEDPSSFYEVLEPIGKGGSSKIFKVRRLADQKICCLKYMKPNDDFEKELIIDEVAILKFNPGDCIISLQEAFYFKEMYWVFLEVMDGSLGNVLFLNKEPLPEHIIKYVLWRTLKGIHQLH